MSYSVGEVAKLARVSVRALHHYDRIGLLEPSARSAAGYRQYDDKDLERLQQILLLKEVGFPLAEIARVLQDPAFDRRLALLRQRQSLLCKAGRIEAMVAAIDKTLDAIDKGVEMDKEEMFEVFGDFDPQEYAQEVRERFDPELVAESERRTARYTKDDWKVILAEQKEIVDAIARRMDLGPEAEEVRTLVERHRLLIDRYFYPCSAERHAGLGDLYVSDPRFTEHFEKIRPGLAAFMRDAMRAAR